VFSYSIVESRFFITDGRDHCYFLLCLPAEEYQGKVGLGGWLLIKTVVPIPALPWLNV